MKITLLSVLLAAGLVQADAIRLRTATIDTRAPRPRVTEALAQQCTARGTAMYLVQFSGPVLPEWKAQLAATGCVLHDYVPDNAFLVEATPAQMGAAALLECVCWTGEFMPEYKVCDQTDQTDRTNLLEHLTPSVIVPGEALVLLFSAADAADVAAEITARGGAVISASENVMRARFASDSAKSAAGAALVALAAVEGVLPALRPRTVNDIATGPGKLNVAVVWTNGTGLTGRGQIIGHADTGLDNGVNDATMHPDFTNRIKAAFALGLPGNWSDRDTYSHGTHTAGSILGNGSASGGQFKGVAYEAQLVHQSTEDAQGNLSGIPDDLRILYRQAYTNSARLHSNSWGADSEYINGTYYTWCRDTDDFVWQNTDMTILFAAGNGAYDTKLCGVIGNDFIILPGTSKNVITIGAAENLRTPGTGGATAREYMQTSEAGFRMPPIRRDKYSTPWRLPFEGMVAWSARGPCDDGRIKPDLVAVGSDVVSCRTSMTNFNYWSNLYPGNSNYLFMSGTSMATPLAAGCAAIVRQYLQERRGIANPSAALIKALLCAGARSLHPGQYGTGRYLEIPKARPNNVEGWGMIDLANTVTPAAQFTNIYLDRFTLNTGERHSYTLDLSGQHQLCAMLVWSDYKGNPTAASALVNDLDLLVITPDGVTNYPNALRGADRTNNVEGVLLEGAPQAGLHRIEVAGYNVPQGPQPYALVLRENTYHAPVVVMPTNLALVAAVGGSASAVITISNNANAQAGFDIETLPAWYTVSDSTMPGGPAYSWIDIASSGMRITNFDNRNATALLSNAFDFPFFGRSYRRLKISMYGALSFTNMIITFDAAPYPNRYGAIPKLGVLQDYFITFGSDTARMYWHTNATRTVVSWVNVENGEEGGAPVTFQALLFSNGVIKFQYKTMNSSATRKASIGIQGHILSNDPYWCEAANYFPRPVNNLAVQFDPPPHRWLTTSADDGVLPPGAVSNVATITASAAGLTAGVYRANVTVYHSGRNANVVIPVTFTVTSNTFALVDYHAHELAGDGDGFAEPGETGALHVSVFNGLGRDVSNVIATLSSDGPFATVLHDTSLIGDIALDRLASNLVPFTFLVAPTATNGMLLPFTLVCADDNDTLLSNALTVAVNIRSVLAGTVRDVADNTALSNATVFWQDTSVHSAPASNTGAFHIAGLAPRVYSVWADAPGYTASDPLSITCPPDVVNLPLALGKPLPWCSPSSFAVEMGAPGISTAPLLVSNAGFGKLHYSLARSNSVIGGITWLKLASSNGMVLPFAATTTLVTFDAAWLDEGTYHGAITLQAEAPPVHVPVTLTILPEPALALAAALLLYGARRTRHTLSSADDPTC